LYEVQRLHASLMVVGGPSVGKTSCIQMLLKTLGAIDGGIYRESRVNPKSMDVDQLFGSFNATTSDWVDGVFPVLLRRATRMTRGQSAVTCTKHRCNFRFSAKNYSPKRSGATAICDEIQI